MNYLRHALWVMVAGALIVGCAHREKPLLPVHDEVLVYELPFDVTYLRATNALLSVPGWDLETTVKEAGLISVRNIDYSGLDDSDQRVVNFVLKRLDTDRTSIEIAKESQQVFGAGALIKAVAKELGPEGR